MKRKILWFTNTPSNASIEFGNHAFGGGWISSLETLLNSLELFELGVCFFYNGNSFKKFIKDSVVYYGLPLKLNNGFLRIKARQFALLKDEELSLINKVIEDFEPDLIHVFGTESGFSKLLIHKSDKAILSLQGLLGPITNVYFPPGFSKVKILLGSSLGAIMRGLTPFHDFRVLKKKAEREEKVIKNWKYFTGRTDCDRQYIALLNSEAEYFHCDELMRKEFYLNKWDAPSNINSIDEITIGSTISANLYKGLDLVYKVSELVEGYHITWKIFGVSENDVLSKVVRRVFKNQDKKLRIQFYGQLNSIELIEQLKTCHFFVHPSYIDNSPNSVCEAMLLGMPVLSSSVGGLKTLIKHEESGFLFNPYDKYDLAGLLIDLIKNYDKAKIAGINSRVDATKRHSPDGIIADLLTSYNYILNKNGFES